MHDAAAGGHPLHVAGAERTAIAEAVAMLDRALEYVRYRFDAAVRMPRKAGEIILRAIVAKGIQEQERIGLGRFGEAEGRGVA